MNLLTKITAILDATNAEQYGYSKTDIAECVGKTIEVEIPCAYVKGQKHIVNWFLPTDNSLRYTRKKCELEVEVI